MASDDWTGTSPEDTGRVAVPTEWVVARVRPHARRLFVPAILVIALAGATPYFLGILEEPWQRAAVGAGAGILFVFAVLFPYVLWLNRRYTITSRRVIARHGFFVRTRREVFHSRGYTVTLTRGWGQSIFRSGTIVLATGLEAPLRLDDVVGAGRVCDALNELVERSQTAVPRSSGTGPQLG